MLDDNDVLLVESVIDNEFIAGEFRHAWNRIKTALAGRRVGCVCAQKKAEESANSLQQLKAEIAALAKKLDDAFRWEGEHIDTVNDVIKQMRQLSAV